MSFLVVANFKSHKTRAEVESWAQAVPPHKNIVIAPSFPHLALMHSSTPAFTLCAQDVSPYPQGAYTGAVNAQQLHDLGVKYCLVGHSERRLYFHETNAQIANKVKELRDATITPIVCLREEDIIPQHAALDDELIPLCLFCFEPEGGLGGTQTMAIHKISQVLARIQKLYHTTALMYGGSVTSDNIQTLLPLNLAGVLVSTASLNPESFNAIIHQTIHVQS